MKNKLKKLFSLIMAVLLVVGLTACGNGSKEDPSKGFTATKVVMTYVKSPLNVPSIVEKAQQSFETAYGNLGVDFAYSELTSGADQTAALASGEIQILNAVGGTSVILSAANGADIKIIGMYSTSPKAFKLFSADDTINSPADLRGKTIAGPKGTNLHELLTAYLAKGGLTLKDVNYISMDIPSSLAALEGGSIDCALQAGASAYNCAKAGYHLVTDGDGLIAGTILTATTQKFYDENKPLIDAFLQVQKDTLDFINQHHDEAIKLAAEGTGLETDAVEEMFTLYDFRMDLTDKDIAALEATQQFMLDNGLIESTVKISDIILNR